MDANQNYSSKLASGSTPHKTIFALGWTVDELKRVNNEGRQLLVQCQTMKERHAITEGSVVSENIPRQLSDLRSKTTQFVKGATRFMRTAATHLLVFMISHESRDRKPYALPVQCLPYTGMSEANIRGLANKLIQEMVKRGMKVAGTVS